MTDKVYRRCCGMDVHKDTIVCDSDSMGGLSGPVAGQEGADRGKRRSALVVLLAQSVGEPASVRSIRTGVRGPYGSKCK